MNILIMSVVPPLHPNTQLHNANGFIAKPLCLFVYSDLFEHRFWKSPQKCSTSIRMTVQIESESVFRLGQNMHFLIVIKNQ